MAQPPSPFRQAPSIIALLCLLNFLTGVEGAKKSIGVVYNNKSNIVHKLFVFGDSFVDTGNNLPSESYKPPYGITFPGKPAGRFSDGRVLADYVASYLKIETPTPYALRSSSRQQQYGINFAYAGTGIYKTIFTVGPNLSLQIDSLEKLIQQNVYTKPDLESSVALVDAGGNDYGEFVLKNRSITEVKVFTESLIKQLSLNLKRVHSLGISKIAVGLLAPMGCTPLVTAASSHGTCVETFNSIAKNHNQILLQSVQQLNKETGKLVFITLDLYNAIFSTIQTMQKKRAENPTLMNPLQPCCEGINSKSCGSVNEKGEKEYKLCQKPELSFYWDSFHPSQNGWNSVYMMLQSSLSQLM